MITIFTNPFFKANQVKIRKKIKKKYSECTIGIWNPIQCSLDKLTVAMNRPYEIGSVLP